ncbi:MAG TPA: thioester domain-containing protein [Vicinamibacterales bacterium]|nr:thioester domain-containing protein [Vicinamibacterales bacterium]HPW19654.1 thioester domain-containing protein [Vicinamibacterales bacterium]
MMSRTIKAAALAGTLSLIVFGAVPAQADPVYLKGYGLGVAGLEVMAPHYFRTFAGQLLLDMGSPDAADDFIAYCIDPTRTRTTIQDMSERALSELPDLGNPAAGVQPNAGGRIAWLINTYAGDAWLRANADSADQNARAAALQLAIWEVLFEPFGSYSLTSGSLKLLWAAENHPLILSYSNLYFSSLGANTAEALWYDIRDPQNGYGQDYAGPLPVPESGSFMLVAAGLLGALRAATRRGRP